MKKSVVFIGTPDFAVESLKALDEDEDIDVELVITGQDKRRSKNKLLPTPVKRYAMEHKIPVITPEDINSDIVYETLNEIDPEFIVIVAYGQVIKERLLRRFKDRILNIHSSLLPKHRGAAPIQWSIINGDKVSGVTIMLVEERLDAGDILLQESLPIGKDERADSLHDRLAKLGGELIVKVIHRFDERYLNRKIQNENEATYCSMIQKKMGRIDFNETPEKIYNKMRGFSPWPGVFFNYHGENVKIHNMYTIHEYNNHSNGKVVQVKDDGIKISCQDGYIVLTEIQFPNKRKMDVSSYLLGNDFEEGILLHQ
ncbi:MAG: methionyl-tRNA formyltransferase [Tissierellia bacterium]|nr:methionyl-tRNA formyltransferase [Tissierellia bacterium]